MRIGSLFSGAGGLDMAVEEVFGGEVIWQAEVDKAASKVLAYRFPCAPNLGDITQIDWKTVEPVDVLCGGFPCQDVSAAGKRAGIKAGTRSGLWSVFADAIDQLRPPLVVIENVRGLLSAQAHRNVEPDEATVGDRPDGPVLRALGAVLGDLADLGYDAQWTTVAAADVGAPHRRERVFILTTNTAISSRDGLQQQDLSALQQRRGDRRPGESGVCHCGDSACVADASDASGNGWDDEGRPESARIVGGSDAAVGGHEPGVALLPTPRATDPAGAQSRSSAGFRPQLGEVVRTLPGEVRLLPTPRSSDCFGAGQHGDGGMDLRTTVTLLPTPKTTDLKGTDSQSDHDRNSPNLSAISFHTAQWGKYAAAIHRWERIAGSAPAPTEPNRNGNPRLNPAFSEWMMGWPAGWVTDPDIGISRNDQLKIVGNGVCPQQAAAALRYLLTVAEVAA